MRHQSIELTDRAAKAMKAALQKAGGRGVRVDVRTARGGRVYRLTVADGPRSPDVVVETGGIPFYFASRFDDGAPLRIDYVRRDGREGFTVQTLGGCGCGPGCACGG